MNTITFTNWQLCIATAACLLQRYDRKAGLELQRLLRKENSQFSSINELVYRAFTEFLKVVGRDTLAGIDLVIQRAERISKHLISLCASRLEFMNRAQWNEDKGFFTD